MVFSTSMKNLRSRSAAEPFFGLSTAMIHRSSLRHPFVFRKTCSKSFRYSGWWLIQWIGLRENLQENPIFNGKNHGFPVNFLWKPWFLPLSMGFSCKFPLNQSIELSPTPLKNDGRIVSWDDVWHSQVFQESHKIPWFQTTNQLYIYIYMYIIVYIYG